MFALSRLAQYALFVCLAFAATASMAEIGPHPTTPVIGVIGSAHGDCTVPAGTPFSSPDHTGGFWGCSARGWTGSLFSNKFRVISAAQAASFTFDQEGTGWRGWQWQVDDLIARTGWFDGVPRLKAVILSIPGDCGRYQCDAVGRQDYFVRVQAIVDQLKAMGILPIIEKYPPFERLDLALTAATYGFPYLPSESEYTALRDEHEVWFGNQEGVLYIDPWNMIETHDGFHPTDAYQLKAGKKHALIFEDRLGLQ